MTIEFNSKYNLSLWRPIGTITLKIIVDELSDFVVLEKSRSRFDRFANLSEADFSQIKFEDIQKVYLLRKAKYTGLPVKSVFYVKSDLQFGIARMYQTLMTETPIGVEIFKTPIECAKYLNVPLEVLLLPA